MDKPFTRIDPNDLSNPSSSQILISSLIIQWFCGSKNLLPNPVDEDSSIQMVLIKAFSGSSPVGPD